MHTTNKGTFMINSKLCLVTSSVICLLGTGLARADVVEKIKFKVQTGVMKCEWLKETLGCEPAKLEKSKEIDDVIEIDLKQFDSSTPIYGEWSHQLDAAITTFSFNIEVSRSSVAAGNEYYFALGVKDNLSNEAHTTMVVTDSAEHLNKVLIQGKQITQGKTIYYPVLVLSSALP